MFPNSQARKPPFASAETLFSLGPASALSQGTGIHNIMSFDKFKRLDPDSKNAEILRLLPLLGPFVTEFKGLRRDIDVACNKLEEMENNKKNTNNNNNNHNHNNNTVFSNTADDASSIACSIPLLSTTDQPIPDPFIITKSRTLNK